MFAGCTGLETLNMSGEGWKTSSLYLMVHVWEGCSSLKSLDLSYLNTSGVHSMAKDFNGCSSLEYLDLSGADTTNVGSLGGLFDGCEKLSTVKLGAKFTFNGVSDKAQCSLPNGTWKSAATGRIYASADVPNCTADTYTRLAADDEGDSEKKVTSITVNKKTVDANAVADAIAAAGGEPKAIQTITLGKKVRGIARGAFKRTNATTIVVNTTKLSKSSVRGALKGSKVEVVEIKSGAKTDIQRAKKVFAEKNVGKAVKVKAA